MLLDLFMFEFMALYVGAYQIVEQTAAHIAFSNIVMINGGIISGYACTCMIKAGHLAGMDDPAGLRVLIRRGVLICLGSMEVQYFIVLTFHNYIFDFYTKDERVLERMRGLLFIYFFYCVFDTLMFIGGNLYKAIKYGSWVSKIFVLSYYGVGGIALIILTFTMENKVKVAWLGFMVGSICITVLMWLKSQ
jgi:Na+-driven multidrug efflux pump